MNFEPDLRNTPRHKLTAREVLDMHADLQRMMAEPGLKPLMAAYGLEDIQGKPEWAASHLHPSRNLHDLEPWLSSLNADLISARTYQVTEEMVKLAQAVQHSSPSYAEITAKELPAPAGFIWLDMPVPRPSVDDDDHPPLMMHAVSWVRVPDVRLMMPSRNGRPAHVVTVPGIRIREWGYTGLTDVIPRPLYLIGQTTLALGGKIHTSLPSHIFLRTLFLLMGMEITASTPERPGRTGARRASNLKKQDIYVVQLRRKAHQHGDAPPKTVDWSCTWIVRGHDREAPHGGTFKDGRTKTWVRPYLKGPDGKPLNVTDIVYRLSR